MAGTVPRTTGSYAAVTMVNPSVRGLDNAVEQRINGGHHAQILSLESTRSVATEATEPDTTSVTANSSAVKPAIQGEPVSQTHPKPDCTEGTALVY